MNGTDLLMGVMERIAECGEARDMLVVWNDEHGKVRLKANCNFTRALGLAQYAQAELLSDIVKEAD